MEVVINLLLYMVISFRRKNNRATAENALARLRDLLELKEFNQDADEVFFNPGPLFHTLFVYVMLIFLLSQDV